MNAMADTGGRTRSTSETRQQTIAMGDREGGGHHLRPHSAKGHAQLPREEGGMSTDVSRMLAPSMWHPCPNFGS